MSRTTTKLLAALATVPLLAGLAACAAPAAGENAGDDVVKIGVVGKSDPQWTAFEEAAADEGITIELVDFADYAQPNPATTEGELDLNQFQHIVYLADYNVSAGEDLTPIGADSDLPARPLLDQVRLRRRRSPRARPSPCRTTRRTRPVRSSCCSPPDSSS